MPSKGETNSKIMNFNVADVRDAYNLAEQHIKLVEHHEGLAFPPVNELRYAGQHLCRAVVETDDGVKEKHYQDALDHCRRASYDALEILLSYYLEKCIKFQDDYRQVLVGDILGSYLDDRKVLNAIKQKSMSRDHKNRGEYFADVQRDGEIVRDISEHWENARPELNKKVETDRRESRRWVIGIAIAVGVFILALLTFFRC
jgi:hypothetical protein